jgi:hypothetical protein
MHSDVSLRNPPGRYPAGEGPIERVARHVANGEISLAAVIEEVQRVEIKIQLAPLYVNAIFPCQRPLRQKCNVAPGRSAAG